METAQGKKGISWWLKNYWYYYKLPIAISLVVIVAVGILIAQCSVRVQPDLTVVVATKTTQLSNDSTDQMQSYFEKITKDVNKDGRRKVELEVLPITDSMSIEASQTKLVLALQSGSNVLFFVDDYAYNYITQQTSLGKLTDYVPNAKGVTEAKLPVKDTQFADTSFGKEMSGMYLVIRDLSAASLNTNKNKPYISNSVDVLKKIVVSK